MRAEHLRPDAQAVDEIGVGLDHRAIKMEITWKHEEKHAKVRSQKRKIKTLQAQIKQQTEETNNVGPCGSPGP